MPTHFAARRPGARLRGTWSLQQVAAAERRRVPRARPHTLERPRAEALLVTVRQTLHAGRNTPGVSHFCQILNVTMVISHLICTFCMSIVSVVFFYLNCSSCSSLLLNIWKHKFRTKVCPNVI